MLRRAARAAVLSLLAGACAGTRAGPGPLPERTAHSALAGAAVLESRLLAPGVTLVTARDKAGPWVIHVIEIDLDQCSPRLAALKAGPPLSRRATTTELAGGAIAAINADFFEIPGGTTVGAHVDGGTVLIGPGERPVFAATRAGFAAGIARIEGFAAVRSDTLVIRQVNRAKVTTSGATMLTHWHDAGTGDALATDSAVHTVIAHTLRGGDAAGTGVVAAVDVADTAVIRSGRVGFRGAGPWFDRRVPGDTVVWSAHLALGRDTARLAVGGFPVLVRDGRDVSGRQPGVLPSFGDRRHPRTAVGWSERRLHLVVVDGRQQPWSDGMTLHELGALMLRLGARHAINLDGGGSSAMVVYGRVVNRPSDPTGERPVGNALALRDCVTPPDPR